MPEVIGEASGDRVLTMTFLDGADWAAAQHGGDQDLKNCWAETISRFVTGSYRHGNLFHADPHPGNYRFGSDGTVGFVDFGCVKVLTDQQRRRIVGVARATIDGRKTELRDLMVDSGFLTADSSLTVDESYEWWAAMLYEMLVPQPVTYTTQASERAVASMLDIGAPDHPMRGMPCPPTSCSSPGSTCR